MKSTNRHRLLHPKVKISSIVLCIGLTSIAIPANSDDTEIFYNISGECVVETTTNTEVTTTKTGNILFVVDNSTSMNKTLTNSNKTRYEVVQEALTKLINNADNVNIGMMGFMRPEKENSIFPIRHANAPHPSNSQLTHKDYLQSNKDLSRYGGTPIVASLYEATMLFRGDKMLFGAKSKARIDYGFSNGYYISPIADADQENYIVLLTDGKPHTRATEHLSKVEELIGKSCKSSEPVDTRCGKELVDFFHNEDQASGIAGKQTITLHTIAFDFSGDYTRELAAKGGGKFYEASNAEDLDFAFDDIISNVETTTTTVITPVTTSKFVSAPTISVNSFSRFSHNHDVYFTLFQPELGPGWPGNFKRYQLTSDGLRDKNNNPAIDSATGEFKSNAQSYWSASKDGDDILEGGAASRLPAHGHRNIYYNRAASDSTTLTNSVNNFDTGNSSLIGELKSLTSLDDAEVKDIIDWARGKDVLDHDEDGNTSEDRKQLNDSLHTTPFVVTYGGSSDNPTSAVYYGDNAGFLRAINTSNGEELFSFIPHDLLGNLSTLYSNDQEISHFYGLDGPISAWIKDEQNDGAIAGSDDHAYLYVTMRRGGRNIYALDVSNRNQPKLKWVIKGGEGDFKELGQTWSRALKLNVRINNNVEDVLLFAGGYDTKQDNDSSTAADTMGRAIYMVNAETGKLVWSAGKGSGFTLNLGDMEYSIPSGIRAIDVNRDGLVDQFYVGDMGGQVWRFDVNNGSSTSNLVSGGVIAKFAGSGAQSKRRFYHAPDVASVVDQGVRKLAISIGSGYHAHPLNTSVDDRFYLMLMDDVLSAPSENKVITESDLYNATDNIIGEGSNDAKEEAILTLNNSSGWYIQLKGHGEKVLASSVTFNNVVYFTTYTPGTSSDPCEVNIGTSLLYSVNIADATPVSNVGSVSGNLTISDRSEDSGVKGIAAPPLPVKVANDNKGFSHVLCVGTNCNEIENAEPIVPTFWRVD